MRRPMCRRRIFPARVAPRRSRAMCRPGPPAPASTPVAKDPSAVAPLFIPAFTGPQKSRCARSGSPAEHHSDRRVQELRSALPGGAVDSHLGREYDFHRRPDATPNGFGALPSLLPARPETARQRPASPVPDACGHGYCRERSFTAFHPQRMRSRAVSRQTMNMADDARTDSPAGRNFQC